MNHEFSFGTVDVMGSHPLNRVIPRDLGGVVINLVLRPSALGRGEGRKVLGLG